jgi:two-component system response regulator RegX3
VTRIMLVDDEPLITDSLSYSLQREGYEVEAVADGALAIDAIKKFDPDLVVLDIMLPGVNGMEVCRKLRAESNIPVIMLTARGDELDRILGLEVGADDYLAKPFSFRELLARIRSLLRRIELDRQIDLPKSMEIGSVTMDTVSRRLIIKGGDIPLSIREFDLLAFLMQNAGKALSREELLDHVWGSDWIGDPRTLDVHIRWLRLKIEEDPASPVYIQTVRGHGYRFVSTEELKD